MSVLRAEVRLPYKTGLPRDVAINVFWFDMITILGGDLDDIRDRLRAFYDEIGDDQTFAVNHYLSDQIDKANAIIHFDSVDDDTHTLHFEREDSLELSTTGTGDTLPYEVALCSSYYSTEPGEGANTPARTRGRIYIGPLSINTLSGGPDPFNRPSDAFINNVAMASRNLQAQNGLTVGNWIVFSKASGGARSTVTAGWVDNEWDTQRRRGVDASARTSWAA